MIRLGIITDAHYAADRHFGNRQSGASVAKIKSILNEMPKVDRLVNLGDMVNASGDPARDMENIRTVREVLDGWDAPCVHVLGNHDCEAAPKTAFVENGWYAFTLEGVRFIVLDGNFVKAGGSYDQVEWDWTDAWIHDDQRGWLEAELAACDKAVILVHQNLDDRGDDPHLIGNAAGIREVLEKSGKVLAVLQGHCHSGCFNEQNGIPYYTFPALCEGFNAPYALVEIDGDQVRVTRKKAAWPDTIRLAGVVEDSVVDGPGMRLTVFTQGCPHHCPGCHNPQTHDFEGGHDEPIRAIMARVEDNPLLSGVTLSGGEPFMQPLPCLRIAKEAHALGLNVWAYTGYTIERLLEEADAARLALLNEIDVLVDGPFIMSEKSLECRWRGSKNQRLIDAKASVRADRAVEYIEK